MPISSTSASVPAGASSTVMGSPISVLRFSRLATVRRLLGEHRGEDVLRRGLAHRAGDPDHGAAQRAPPRGGEALQGGQRIVRGDDRSGLRAARGVGVRRARRAPPTRRRPAPARAKRPPSTCSPTSPTNRSPGPAARESITARDGPPACGAGATSRPPAACATCSGDHSCTQRLTGDGDVVEGHLAPALELLALLVALAGHDDDVARPRQRDGALDRGAAVDDPLCRPARPAPRRR